MINRDLPLGKEVALCALSSGDSEAGGRPPINKSEKIHKLCSRHNKQRVTRLGNRHGTRGDHRQNFSVALLHYGGSSHVMVIGERGGGPCGGLQQGSLCFRLGGLYFTFYNMGFRVFLAEKKREKGEGKVLNLLVLRIRIVARIRINLQDPDPC